MYYSNVLAIVLHFESLKIIGVKLRVYMSQWKNPERINPKHKNPEHKYPDLGSKLCKKPNITKPKIIYFTMSWVI